MKLKTHNIFTTGILTFIGSFFTSPYIALFIAVILSFAGNNLIDSLGHNISIRTGKPVRNARTHTLFRGTFVGFIPALIIFAIIHFLVVAKVPLSIDKYPYWILLDGLSVGITHLFLDIITENGIFRKLNGRWQRIAWAHIPYNSIIYNSLFIIIGILIVYLSFNGGNYGRIIGFSSK